MNPPQTKRWRILRRCLVGGAVCLTLIGLFYTEELWRGKRAWDDCKRTLQAQGVNLDWTHYIPAPVPQDQNVFGVPEMQRWFVGRGATDLSKKLSYPGYGKTTTTRLVVAELTISLPGAITSGPTGATVLRWGDPHAQAEASRLIKDALGPVALNPIDFIFMLRSPGEIRPAQMLLQCQTAPTAKELLQFLPNPIANTEKPAYEKIKVEPAGGDSFKVTMDAPDTVTEFLKWSEQLEPEFALIHKALQRPYSRMDGDYSGPLEMPIPSFVTIRAIEQMLATMAQCHLLQGKPDEALRDFTLMHNLCRIDTNKPITLVGAMINVAVRGLYVNTIANGLRWHAWREPQLAALEEQLKTVNVLPAVQQAFELDGVSGCHIMETTPPVRLFNLYRNFLPLDLKSLLWRWRLMPRGWIYQNAVTLANLSSESAAAMEPAGQIVFPDKAKAHSKKVNVTFPNPSPSTFIAVMAMPNFNKALCTTALNQTKIHQALIACALERYYLQHGHYPEKLDALAPQFLAEIPNDVIGGQPPHYRRAADGTFILYSIGWSGRDGGGVPGKSNDEGDWVWPD
jgi:hypothetical protein